MALISPRDNKVPRVIVPLADCPHGKTVCTGLGILQISCIHTILLALLTTSDVPRRQFHQISCNAQGHCNKTKLHFGLSSKGLF